MNIENETLDSPVSGVNLIPGSFRDQMSEEPTLLVFLRFFGCMFCRETVSDLRQLSEGRADFPAVLFVSATAKPGFRRLRRRRRRKRGLCLSCGYNLTGNTSGVCPECAAKVEG